MFENENTAKKVLFASLLGAGTTLISSLILILISALILNFTPDPAGIISPVGKAILYVTAIMGGYIAMLKGEKIASPIISGALMTVLVLVVSMLSEKNEGSTIIAVIAYLCIFLSFLAGGILRYLITSKRPSRKRRRR
jgi:hypothetical protein